MVRDGLNWRGYLSLAYSPLSTPYHWERPTSASLLVTASFFLVLPEKWLPTYGYKLNHPSSGMSLCLRKGHKGCVLSTSHFTHGFRASIRTLVFILSVTCDTCSGKDTGHIKLTRWLLVECAKLLPEWLGDAGKPCIGKRRNRSGSLAAVPALGS